MSRLPWKTVTNSLKTWSYIIIIIIQIVNYLEQRHWLTFRLGMSRQVCQSTKTKAVDPEADGSHPCLISHLPPISCDERLSTCGHSFACPLASGSSAPHQRVLLLPGPPTQEVDLLFRPRTDPQPVLPQHRQPDIHSIHRELLPSWPLAGDLFSRAAALRASAHFHAAHYHCLLFYKGPEHCSRPRAGLWELSSSAVPN